MASESEQSRWLQRVKVGLLGLAGVVLLIAFASAIMRTVSREAPVSAVGAPKADVIANMVVTNTGAGAGEPLAEIGVAPVSGNGQSAAAQHR